MTPKECPHELTIETETFLGDEHEKYCGACWLTSGKCSTIEQARERFKRLDAEAKRAE